MIVFTNGCFDLLHIGHVDILAYCAKFKKDRNDKLIVGVNSDRSVRALKGSDRPIIPEEERRHIVASIKGVDNAIIFDEDTPYELMMRIKPNIVVKGSDWRGKTVTPDGLGCRIEFFDFKREVSTTDILRKIKDGP